MKNKGFSLVELIVVIAIMAILVGVAVPVYSSYIEKANKAKDEQLLGEINSAFAVALAGNAIDINTVTEADIPVENGVVKLSDMTVNGAENETIENAMIGILGSDLEFAVIEDIFYNEDTHKFEDDVVTEYAYGGGKVYLSAEDVAKLKASTFGTEMTVEELLAKVGDVTGYAALMSGTNALTKVFTDPNFLASATKALGVEASELGAKVDELAAEMVANNPGMTQQEAVAQVQANAAVLFAAQNATQMSMADITDLLTKDGASDTISGNLNTNAGTALSQAALAYGMYTSYAYYTGDADLIAKTETPDAVLNGLDDEGFQAYMASAQGQKDLEGYLSALNMINSSTGDSDAVENLMVKGFDDSELAGVLNQSMGN